VVLAGPDAQVAALGAGCVAPGDIVVMAGWSAPVQRVTKRPMPDGARRTWVVRHPVDGRWASEANPGDTGGTLDMVRRLLGPRMSPLRLDRLAASAPRTDLSVYALWGPRALDLSNPGMSLGGLLTPSPVTYEGIGAAQVARATLENIAYAIRECVELLAEVCGAGANEVALTGGMANSEVFAEMLATTLGCTVRRHDAQGAAIGAAIVASLGRDEWAKAAAAMVDRGEAVHPGGDVVETNERYGRWLRLRAGLDALADEV
jgi:xylulokinase